MPYHVSTDVLMPTMAPAPGMYAGIQPPPRLGQYGIVGTVITVGFDLLNVILQADMAHDAALRARHERAREQARQAELAAAEAKMLADAQRAANVGAAITHQPPSPLGGLAAGGQQVAAALGSPMGLIALVGAGAAVLFLMRR